MARTSIKVISFYLDTCHSSKYRLFDVSALENFFVPEISDISNESLKLKLLSFTYDGK